MQEASVSALRVRAAAYLKWSLYRDRVAAIFIMCCSIRHPPGPSLADSVAGVAAMADVLGDHDQQEAAQQMLMLLDEVREASWLATGTATLVI